MPSLIPGAQRLAFALDVSDARTALALADQLAGVVGVYKVGLELFTAEGPAMAREIAKRGQPCLDLKLHDIPHTVEGAARAAAALGASYLTVHASGGRAMIEAAVRGAGAVTKVLAVTVLTSLADADLRAAGLAAGAAATTSSLGKLALEAGAAGLVCSAAEIASLRATFGTAPLLAVPGIRPTGSDPNDQSRTGTPSAAIAAGASLLVVGRPIREAKDPRAAAAAIAAEIAASLVPSLIGE